MEANNISVSPSPLAAIQTTAANSGSGLTDFFYGLIFIFLSVFLAMGGIIILGKFYKKSRVTARVKQRIDSASDISYLHIKISPNNDQKAEAVDEFLSSLHRLLPQGTHLSLEMGSYNQFLNFFLVVDRQFKSLVESQIYAQFSDAEIQEVEDYLKELDNTAIAEMDFKHTSLEPIQTYKTLQEDLLKNLSAYLSKIETSDRVFIQLALKRVGSKLRERDFKNLSAHLFKSKNSDETVEHVIPNNNKLTKDLYLGKIRIIYQSTDQINASRKLNTFLGLLKILKSEDNELKKKNNFLSSRLKLETQARVFEEGDFWTPSELATIYHFPYKGGTVSNVVQTSSKRSPAPDILPYEGQVEPSDVTLFAETNFRNDHRKFGVKRIDRRRHLYVVGKTGSGKSRLLQLLLISDIINGHGCCLLDPHGDLAQELLQYIPKERIKDVVYIDPSDKDFPIGFNPLEPVPDYETRQHLSTFFISIFKKLFAATWNPRMENLLRFITLALLETPDSNIMGIPRILSDTNFRQRVIMQIKDPVVKGFWINEFSASDAQLSQEAIIPIVNKVGQFVANPVVRNMIGQRKNQLNFSKFMDEGKIVLINDSKGKLGDENSALLGAMFITKIQQAALARANVSEDQRRDFYFYVDEFQNFATDAFASILSEARKYHLNLTIAHQYMAQLPEEVKATAFGNVGTIISFAVGGDDASYLAKEFAPTFTAEDLINLNLREMYIKMSVDGKLTPPFSAQTINTPKPGENNTESILSNSRLTYGKNKVAVENEIAQWTQSSEGKVANDSTDTFPEPIL
jgi:cytochrome c553